MHFPSDISADDAHQWLRGGWFLVNGELARLQVAERRRVVYDAYDVIGQPLGMKDAPFKDVELWWPRCGAVNIVPEGGALYVQRHPARQWRRTMSPRELQLSIPHKWVAERNNPERTFLWLSPESPEVAASLLNPAYPSMDEAFDMLEDQTHVAVSRQVVLVQVSFSETVVYYNNHVVGFIGPDRVFVPDSDERFAKIAARVVNKGARAA